MSIHEQAAADGFCSPPPRSARASLPLPLPLAARCCCLPVAQFRFRFPAEGIRLSCYPKSQSCAACRRLPAKRLKEKGFAITHLACCASLGSRLRPWQDFCLAGSIVGPEGQTKGPRYTMVVMIVFFFLCVCVCMCVYVCICVCYICMYIHIHMCVFNIYT